ncbi:MAG: hypothetical protein R2822_10885 [Spirosomataceae bacterium]
MARIDEKVGFNTAEIWGRYYFHTRQYGRAIDSLNIVIKKAKLEDEQFRKNTKAVNKQPYISPRHHGQLILEGTSQVAVGETVLVQSKDYEQLVGEYKVFGPNLWGRLGVWHKRYSATKGKSGSSLRQGHWHVYEMVRNAPPIWYNSVLRRFI